MMSRENSQHKRNMIAQSALLLHNGNAVVAKELANKIRVLVKTKVFKMMKFPRGSHDIDKVLHYCRVHFNVASDNKESFDVMYRAIIQKSFCEKRNTCATMAGKIVHGMSAPFYLLQHLPPCYSSLGVGSSLVLALTHSPSLSLFQRNSQDSTRMARVPMTFPPLTPLWP